MSGKHKIVHLTPQLTIEAELSLPWDSGWIGQPNRYTPGFPRSLRTRQS